ncbi:hypothetical protein NECAME_09190 [Necator americanus]|uniref:Uncharacterized protein n=1 Tax=Necator americanus TaxID=51031 RepID=W2TEC3_NECAM|nr:hypothetical protein NECAME_09190 [Necator americanus]ETN80400.1 hypothetical protein NECAME_09190 [Necator americanus]
MKNVDLLIYALLPCIHAVARFEPTSVTDVSLVIRMIKGNNVSSFDMAIQIFDLDRLIEYRKTQLRGSTRDQLFSFDGLTPGTWFAFRIHYQLHYENSKEPKHDLKTKQEIIVRTKESQHEDPTKINDSIAYIDDLFLTKDNIYIGVASVFKDTKKVITVIVPELRCSKGVLKPLAQQVSSTRSTRQMRVSSCCEGKILSVPTENLD